MPRAVIAVFSVLAAFWTLLCLGLFAAFGIGSGLVGVVALLLFRTNAEAATDTLTALGGVVAFAVWLVGVATLFFVGRAMHRSARARVIVITTTGAPDPRWAESWPPDPFGERPMKDVTPPRASGDDRPDADRRRDGLSPPRDPPSGAR
jgi:hypothetical protein